jgi:hypothetical protein
MRAAVAREPRYTRLGAIVHDLSYYGNMLAETARYFLRAAPLDAPWGYRMHSVQPARFVASFIAAAGNVQGLTADERLALTGGILSHCALDLALHPLVNYIARRDTDELGGHEAVRHRFAEKYHALFFHKERLGADPIGTPTILEWTDVTKEGTRTQARVEAPIAALIDRAYRVAYGGAPSTTTWARWVRSFRQFGKLASGPIARWDSAKLLGPRHAPALRARYVENDVFSLYEFYAQAERKLVALTQTGAAFLDAGDFSLDGIEQLTAALGFDDLAEPADDPTLPALPRLSVRSTPGASRPAAHAKAA